MSWSPIEARKILDSISDLTFKRSVKKLAGYELKSLRQLALSEENKVKVTLYVSRVPYHLTGVTVEEKYEPTTSRNGRHADLEGLVETLGFATKAYRISIGSPESLKDFMQWYKYA